MAFSVIIPVFNEAANIREIYDRLKKVMSELGESYEFIFINDGSRDNSMQIIRELSKEDADIRYIEFSRNFGHQVAVSAGLDYCTGDTVCIIDADLQDPPEILPGMYKKLKEGYEVVYAKRKRRAGETVFKTMTARLFYRFLSYMTSIKIPVDTGDFRLIDRKIVQILRQMPEKHKFLRGQIAWAGFRQTGYEYERHKRKRGETGYTFRKMLRLALDGITGFSDTPLKLVTYFGFLVFFFAIIAAIYALYSRFILRDFVQGWASLMITVLFIGGIQMIAIGIIGEYLSRMNSNLRDRPLYIIKDTNITGE